MIGYDANFGIAFRLIHFSSVSQQHQLFLASSLSAVHLNTEKMQ